MALLDSDDTWEPDYLSTQLEIMQADPGLAVVYPDARIVGDHPHMSCDIGQDDCSCELKEC